MKLILMTPPNFFIEEHQILTALFDEGLELLHLRKPNTEPVYSERLLTLIPEIYRSRIVVHDHFYLKNEYNLKGIHINSRNPEIPANYRGSMSCTLSTVEDVGAKKKFFNYVFLGPIYKTGIDQFDQDTESFENLKAASKNGIIDKKVMAMGNVSIDNLNELRDLNFGGVVILGDIWNKFDKHTNQDFKGLVNHFRKLKKAVD